MAQSYVKVAYTEMGPDVLLPLCVLQNDVILELSTLKSQFPGAIGLKYNDSGQWKALNLSPKGFCPPEEGWGNRKYIVVTESIGQARSILKDGLASSVSQVFKSRLHVNQTEVQSPSSMIPEAFPLSTRKGKFKCKKKVKKVVEKSVRVVFIQDVEIPTILNSNIILLEGIMILSSEDSEDSVRVKLLEVLQGSTCIYQDEGVNPSELMFLSCSQKKLSYPCVPTSFKFNLMGIKAAIGQGKLYVQLKRTLTKDSAGGNNVDDDDDDEPLNYYNLNTSDGITDAVENKKMVADIPQTAAPEAGSSSDAILEGQSGVDNCGNTETDSGTPTIIFQPRHKRPRNRLSLRQPSYEENAACSSFSSPYRSYVGIIDDVPVIIDDSSDDEQPVEQVISGENSSNERNLYDLLKEISLKIDDNIKRTKVNVTRANPLEGTRRTIHRSSFDPKARVSVRFADDFGISEGAIDEGGPTRELFRLLLKQISELPVFHGTHTTNKILSFNATALNEGLYKDIGILFTMAVVHGAQFPSFLSQSLYQIILKDEAPCGIEDIPEADLRAKIQKLQEATSLEAVQEVMEENSTLFQLCGCFRAVQQFSVKKRDVLVSDLVKFLVISRNLPAIQQLRQGLETLGLLENMRGHHSQFKEVFCHDKSKQMNAEQMEAMFTKVEMSETGSNRRQREERVLTYWRDYLVDIEEGNATVKFEDLLVFATGTDQVPYLGFSPDPAIEFIHEVQGGERKFAQANTCSMVLRLPVVDSYEEFKDNMDFGILNSPGFGMA